MRMRWLSFSRWYTLTHATRHELCASTHAHICETKSPCKHRGAHTHTCSLAHAHMLIAHALILARPQALKHWMGRVLAAAYMQWAGNCAEARRQRQLLSKALGRLAHRQLSRAFLRWAKHVAKMQRRAEHAKRAKGAEEEKAQVDAAERERAEVPMSGWMSDHGLWGGCPFLSFAPRHTRLIYCVSTASREANAKVVARAVTFPHVLLIP